MAVDLPDGRRFYDVKEAEEEEGGEVAGQGTPARPQRGREVGQHQPDAEKFVPNDFAEVVHAKIARGFVAHPAAEGEGGEEEEGGNGLV